MLAAVNIKRRWWMVDRRQVGRAVCGMFVAPDYVGGVSAMDFGKLSNSRRTPFCATYSCDVRSPVLPALPPDARTRGPRCAASTNFWLSCRQISSGTTGAGTSLKPSAGLSLASLLHALSMTGFVPDEQEDENGQPDGDGCRMLPRFGAQIGNLGRGVQSCDISQLSKSVSGRGQF